MTGPATAPDDGTLTRRKSTLFCWECDHSSPIDGDWVRRPRDRHVEYACPDCDTTLAKRPLPDGSIRERSTYGPVVAWRRTLRTAVQVWRTSVDVGFSSVAAMTGVRPIA